MLTRIFYVTVAVLMSSILFPKIVKFVSSSSTSTFTTSTSTASFLSTAAAIKNQLFNKNFSTSSATTSMGALSHATIVPRPSGERGHADHGWLNTYHTFSFASYMDRNHNGFGSLRVLNEDRVAPKQGFPTHPHRDFEIFSYILDGELTHRDSVHGHGDKAAGKDDFFVMKRGDVQFTTGGTGIAHSEFNEHASKQVHFLQIWAKPWARGLPPTYHTLSFNDAEKRKKFVTILSPLVGGPKASAEQEKAAIPTLEGTIPIHADFLMGAAIIPSDQTFEWTVGSGSGEKPESAVSSKEGRNAYIHVPMCKGGKAKIVLDGREDVAIGEGDGAYITNLKAGDKLSVKSVGSEEAEVVILDSD